MIRSLAQRGPIGPLWCRSRARVTYARPRNKGTTAAAVALAGLKMSKKSNTKSTSHGGARTRPKIIDQIHDQWCRDNGYKSSSKLTQEARPQAKGSSFKPKSTSSRIREPGYKRTSWSRAQATRIKVFFLCLIWNDIW